LVNQCDLEKWMKYDNNSEYIYTIIKGNCLFNDSVDGESMTNRFKMYYTFNEKEIAVLTFSDYLIFIGD